ncbi:hypothetical protein Tco_1518374, partial [Tanacetum coccineum]
TLFDVISKIFDFGGLTDLMAKGLSGRMLMEHRDAQGQGVWRGSMGLHTAEKIESVGFGAYWAESARQIPDKGDLSAYWREISSVGDFFGTAPSYTFIRDRCLGWGQFVARLAEHFGLLTKERLQGLTVIVRYLPETDMAELICEELDDIEGAPNVVEGDQAILTPVQAPQPPPAARTISQRLARLEEDVHGIQVSLGKQHEVVNMMAKDFSIFTVWVAGGISQLLDSAGATYV